MAKLVISDLYSKIPFDLSGSSSKNRFRQEMFWGIAKMFEIFDENDFCVVFDYKCDIEIHFNNSIEFYQIKTHKVQKPYSFTAIKKIESKQSIIAKLFLLKDLSCSETPIKCILVSNSYFSIGKTILSDAESFCFSDLDISSQNQIHAALKAELLRDEVDLANLYYLYTSMNLLAPEDDLKGKITGSFEKIKGCEPKRPNALYRLIVETVTERACYELSVYNYEELIKRKGMSKSELNSMLDRYIEKTDDAVNQVNAYIDQKQLTIRERYSLKKALSKMVESEYSSYELQQREIEISSYISNVNNDMHVEEMIELLAQQFDSSFSIEYSTEDKYVFFMLIIKRWESGKYE